MKASPLILVLCLGIAPAYAGSPSGAPGFHAGHGHPGGPHGFRNFVKAVSDFDPGPPAPEPEPQIAPELAPEPASFAPPIFEPAFPPAPYVPAPALPPPPKFRPGPRILYLREPTRRRAGPVVIYGAG